MRKQIKPRVIKDPDDSQDQKMVTEAAIWIKNNDYHLNYSDRKILLSAWLNGLILVNKFCEKTWILQNWLRQGPKFCKLQEAIWLIVINEIFIFYHISNPFVRGTICMNSPQVTRKTQVKNDTFGLVSRLLKRDFVNYRKLYG